MKKTILLFTGLTVLVIKSQAQTVTDIEGNVYNTVAIGTQWWMKENLKTGTYNDGTPIVFPGTNNALWQNNTNGAYSWYLNDSATYCGVYGALYNWFAVSPTTNGGKNICPLNWHVPTHDEWTTLERAVCTSASCVTDFPYDLSTVGYRGTDEGGKLKETGTTHWNSPNTGATNSSLFTGLPATKRDNQGAFSGVLGDFGFFWTPVSFDATYAWSRALNYNNAGISRVHGYQKSNGFSIRCVCNSSVNVNEIDFENKIQVYPNPAIEMVTIDLPPVSHQVEMHIYNLIGELVLQQALMAGKTLIDLRSYPKGIYLIRIHSAEATFQKKLIIE